MPLEKVTCDGTLDPVKSSEKTGTGFGLTGAALNVTSADSPTPRAIPIEFLSPGLPPQSPCAPVASPVMSAYSEATLDWMNVAVTDPVPLFRSTRAYRGMYP